MELRDLQRCKGVPNIVRGPQGEKKGSTWWYQRVLTVVLRGPQGVVAGSPGQNRWGTQWLSLYFHHGCFVFFFMRNYDIFLQNAQLTKNSVIKETKT